MGGRRPAADLGGAFHRLCLEEHLGRQDRMLADLQPMVAALASLAQPDDGESSARAFSSLTDTWLLFVIKSNGMARSNPGEGVRAHHQGAQRLEVSIGPQGVLADVEDQIET